MAWSSIINLLSVFIYLICDRALGQTAQNKRFEYKYSFKGPYIVLKDNSVPFWDVGGHAIASDDQIRLAPSLKARKGYMWTKNPVTFDWWEVEMNFRVSGSGRIGADGLAFWYTTERMLEGDAFGSRPSWHGLGLFFDSFDNDGKLNNPYVYVILNDGTKLFDHDADGSSQQLGGCLRDFRNKPFPVKVKVEYYRNVLTVLMTNGLTSDETPELCLRAENVFLPKTGYFGASAATGGLADDHDVLSFVTNSIHDQSLERTQQISQIERAKLETQFREYNEKLEQQRQEYLQQHPEKAAAQQQQQQSGGPGQFENPQDRALRQIFDGQQFIHLAVQQLNRRIDEIIGRQERTLSAVSSLTQGNFPSVQVPSEFRNMGTLCCRLRTLIVLSWKKISFTRCQRFTGTVDMSSYGTPLLAASLLLGDVRVVSGLLLRFRTSANANLGRTFFELMTRKFAYDELVVLVALLQRGLESVKFISGRCSAHGVLRVFARHTGVAGVFDRHSGFKRVFDKSTGSAYAFERRTALKRSFVWLIGNQHWSLIATLLLKTGTRAL